MIDGTENRSSAVAIVALCTALGLAAGGCAEVPAPTVPAMTALAANGDYGYSETALAPDRYEVTFVTPSLAAPGDAGYDYGLAGQKDRAHALALWRAAQLAIEHGFPAFRVDSESRNVEVATADPPPTPPFVMAPLRTLSGPPCRSDCDNPVGYWGDPYFNPRYDAWYRRSHSSGRVTVTLTVRMLPAVAAGAFDAARTAERLRAAYGASSFEVR